MFRLNAIGLAVACLAASPAFALSQGEYRFNGFGTLGITHLGGEEEGRSYGIHGQTNDSWRGDELSKLGGQFQYGLSDRLNLTTQVTVKAEQDTWKANLEWAYLSFQATDRLTLRAGRLRIPVYMYSETLDVGFTYPWLRLPDEIYHQVQISNYEGVDFIYSMPVSYGSVSVQAFGGQAEDREQFAYDQMFDMDYKKVVGANIKLDTHGYGSFRLAYSEASLNMTMPHLAPLGMADVANDVKGKFTSIGHQYDQGSWLAASEATRLVVEGPTPTKDAFYLMGGHRFGDFLGHVTYAQLDEENSGRQVSWTYGLNYSLTSNVVLKGEYKRVDTSDGGQGVFVQSGGEYISDLLAGTSRTFDGDIISVGLDFVF
ncbi:porin [Pseudomonas saliphila]|uniref:porin n=1 Tax=Pseudomonas saliphila TaxID=2586906 RepID=UPI00123896D6|nr:porin [Pseudomonas saliphila]